MSEGDQITPKVMRQRARDCLQDAENVNNSRHTRMTACFDAIYLMLLLAWRGTEATPSLPQARHPAPHVIVAGASMLRLDEDEIGEILELRDAVTGLRYDPKPLPGNLPRALAIARHVVGARHG